MASPSPNRVLAAGLVLVGAAAAVAGHGLVDESRALGVALALFGITALFLSDTRRLGAALEVAWVTVLVLAGGEIMLRRENAIAQQRYAERLMHFVDDPLLRYEMKPNTSCGEGTTNDRGMLDVARATEKAPGTLRIACLGDSVGGDCSLPRDNACAALERTLAETRSKPVEVLNFSVPGYNTMQEARSLELKAMPMSPDAVVVLYVLNDPYPDLAISHFLPGTFKFEHLLYSGAKVAIARVFFPGGDPWGGFLRALHDDPRSWNGVVVAGFDHIAAAAAGRPVVVAVFPLFVAKPGPEYRAVYAKVVAEAERHGFIGVDLSEAAFGGVPLADLLKPSRDPVHPNAHAHDLAARAIARALIERHPEIAR